MVYCFLPVPFADAARQQLFAAVHTALLAEPDAPATVLLGNLGAFTTIEADALLVRPGGAALLVLMPQGGRLTMPALAYGGWRLNGQPLPPRADADNPFEQYRQQRPAALAWLRAHLGQELADLGGIALFAGPLTFGPEVENHLQHPAAADFQLVGGAAYLPARLQPLGAMPKTALPAAAILAWGGQLSAELSTYTEDYTPPPPTYLVQKLRQLWSWLGAEDIPSDPPYGGDLPTPTNQQERARLEQLRHELQAELGQQRQEAAARETARTQELAQLRQQLAQAGLSAAERRAEQQATSALEEELRTARTELTARNQEMDMRIQQLGQLLTQLHTADKPARPAPTPGGRATPSTAQPVARVAASPAPKPAPPSFRRLRQAERWGVVALMVAGVGVGTWGIVRLAQPGPARPRQGVAPRKNTVFSAQEGTAPNVVYVVDSTLTGPNTPVQVDTAGSSLRSAELVPEATAPARDAAGQSAADSATTSPTAPLSPAAPDSAATPSPTP